MLYKKQGIFLVGALVLSAGLSEAQVPKTFVSVSGNDANDCLTAATACRTINAAITKVDVNGEVIVSETGSYAGAAITKSVRVNAPSGIVAFAALPITINAPAANVSLRGFTIKAVTPGTGTGITVTDVGNLTIESMVLDGWSNGAVVAAVGAKVSVSDSIFRNNTAFGLIDQAASNVSVVRSKFEKNNNGFVVLNGGPGSVSRSSATGNTQSGFGAQNGTLVVDRCLVANNGSGLLAFGGGLLRLANSSISGNTTGVNLSGGIAESFGTSGILGNTTNISGALTPVALQ